MIRNEGKKVLVLLECQGRNDSQARHKDVGWEDVVGRRDVVPGDQARRTLLARLRLALCLNGPCGTGAATLPSNRQPRFCHLRDLL